MATQFGETLNVERGVVGGAGGDDTYVLSAALVEADAEITITDNQGDNIIQLIDGLEITSSIVASDTAQLTLSNGAVVTILGASSFTYEIGGNPLTGEPGTEQNYETFGSDTLGVDVPTEGTNESDPAADPVTIGEDPAGTNFTVTASTTSVDEGQTVTYTIEADGPVDGDTTFGWAIDATGTAGADDFTGATAGTATILDGQTSTTFTVTVTADNVSELQENFVVNVTDVDSNVVDSLTVTINDVTVDNTAPVVGADQTVTYAENQATAGTTLATITATDDTAVTGFSIESGNDSGFFQIDASGNFSLTDAGIAAGAASNDFETGDNTFTVGVQAMDGAGNASDTVDVTVNLTNVDDDKPTVSTSTTNGTTLVLEFNEALDTTSIPAGSAFTVTETAAGGQVTVKTLSATDPVSVNNASVILTLATGIAAGSTVTVSYTPPATNPLQDLAGNTADAVSNYASTIDATAPTLSSSTPADNATGVVASDNLTLTFSESIIVGTGNIVLTNTGDATDTRTINVTDGTQVSVDGATLTINPTADLTAGASYDVSMAAGVITDSIGNSFAGITTAGTLNFTVASDTSTGTGNTFTLTQSADTVPAAGQDNSGNDTINGFLDGGTATFTALDTIDGGTGDDTLTALGMVGNPTLSNVSNVEHFILGSLTAAAPAAVNYDLSQTAGETSVTLQNSQAGVNTTANNINLVAGTPFDIGVNLDAAATSTSVFNFTGTTGTSDVVNLTLNTAQGIVNVDNAANAIETLHIIGTGGNSTLAANGLVIGNNVTTLNMSGSSNVNIAGTNLGTTVGTINASAATGNVLIQQDQAMIHNFVGGSGNDVFLAGDGANITNQDKFDGGAGNDTFSIDANTIPINTAISNFEVVSLDATGLTQNMSNFVGNDMAIGAGLGAFSPNAVATALASTFTNVANNANLYINQNTQAVAATVTLAADGGASDVLNVSLSQAGDTGVVGGLTLNSDARIETVNIVSNGTTANVITAFANTGNVVLTGNNLLTVTDSSGAASIDASNMTAALTVTAGSIATQTITGTALADTLTAGGILVAGATFTFNAGDGADQLTLGGAGLANSISILNGEAGNDTITSGGAATALVTIDGGTGNDTIAAGAGIDTIVSTATTVADADKITAFTTTTDKFDYNGALSNGTTTSGVLAQASGGAASVAADLTAVFGLNANATVYDITTVLNAAGSATGALTNLADGTAAQMSGLYTTFENALIAELGVVTGLDTSLSSTETVLLGFNNGADTVVVRVTNTDTSVANTLTAAEVDLVGVFDAAVVVAGDFM